MKPAYDIFRKDLLGTPVWMESAQDIETAKLRVTELARRSPGEYFVVSQETQEIAAKRVVRKNSIRLPCDRDVGTYLFGLRDLESPGSQLG